MHPLDPGVSGYQIGQGRLVRFKELSQAPCVFELSFCTLDMVVVLYAPWGVEMALRMNWSRDLGVIVSSWMSSTLP